MKHLRTALALLLSAAMALCLAGCHKSAPSDVAGPDTMASAFFDLCAHDDAASMCAALGSEASDAGVRTAFLPSDHYDSMSAELVEQVSGMGITVSEADAKLLADAILAMMDKIECTAQVKDLDEDAGTATVTVQVAAYDQGSFTNAATLAVTEMDLADFLSDDLDAVYSKILHSMAENLSGLQPSGETRSLDVPFSLQEVTIDGKAVRLWAPNNADDFFEQVTALAVGELS